MLTFAPSRLQPYYRLSALAKTICYANALRRCEVFKAAEDQSACRARVMGETEAQGSVAGGGVLRETETVVPAAP